jgi:hypothetical protein
MAGAASPASDQRRAGSKDGLWSREVRADLVAASSPIAPRANERRDIASASEAQVRGSSEGHG